MSKYPRYVVTVVGASSVPDRFEALAIGKLPVMAEAKRLLGG